MAPALTQASESPDLTDATRHSLPPKAITNIGSPHDHIKILKELNKSSLDSVIIPSPVLISNGDCFGPGLAPPACGRAEGRPEASTSPSQFNMEELPQVSISRTSDQEPIALPEITGASSDASMGLQSCLRNVSIASDPNSKGSEVVISHLPNEESQTMLKNQNDFLALMGQDFNNVNDLINTLQSLACNPELLDAAARDFETAVVPQCSPERMHEDRQSIALNHLIERQHQLERRKNFLARRLNRITARGLGITISNQLSYLIQHVRSVIEKDQVSRQRSSLRNKSKLETFHQESMKSMSTSDLISLVKHVEANSSRKNSGHYQRNIDDDISLPSTFCSEISTVVSEWKSVTLSHANHDSDATESSSGGESCDENEQFNKANVEYKPIHQRALYKFCKNRGRIASKWVWLQNQIAELDKKISSHEEIHLKLIREKGQVKLADRANISERQQSPGDLIMQDPALTCMIASPSSTRSMINGYHPNSKVENVALSMQNGSRDTSLENECARTAGLLKIKRRKYLNLKKIVKQSDRVYSQSGTKQSYKRLTAPHCNCSPPLFCILCLDSFHSSKTENMRDSCDNLCDQSIKEKLALIDSSFHPVLSRKPGVIQSETYNKLLRSWKWQQKAFKGKPLIKFNSNLHQNVDTEEEEQYAAPSKRRRKEFKRSAKRTRDERFFAQRVARRNHGSSYEDDEDELSGGWAIDSCHSSPCPSPGLERATKNGMESKGERIHRKNFVSTSLTIPPNNLSGSSSHRFKQNSYDINNIVIPCMTAPPKLETIKYKEIPTPKWRIEEIKPFNNSSSIELEEDISDEAITVRHSFSEELERKKYLRPLTNQISSSRSSRSRRTDSSGTNTPDHPLSPPTLEISPAASPGTPFTVPPSEDSLLAGSDATCADQTGLNLSISSILNCHHKPNERYNKSHCEDAAAVASCADVALSTKSDIPTPRSSFSGDLHDPKPALRARRILSGHNVDRSLRSSSISSIAEESTDRLSPFPSRDFPLTENDYQVLVIENSTSRESSGKSRRRVHSENVVEVSTNNELEGGPRDSPLSELTDSALEEDGGGGVGWEDESAPPDWTISAVHDHSGGFVLQVQKN